MNNSPEHAARPFKCTVVSPDVGVLHDISWMLTAVGYTVASSKDLREEAAWRRFDDADFLIFDGRTVVSPTAVTLAHHSNRPLYRFVLYDPIVSTDFSAWFAAGANDALRVPVSRGELLVRLRAGARALEFEKRTQARSQSGQLAGTYSIRGLARQIKRTGNGDAKSNNHTLLTVAIDYFEGLRRKEGLSAADAILAAFLTALHRTTQGTALVGYAGQGVFQVFLSNEKLPAARATMEQVAEDFRSTRVESGLGTQATLSAALTAWERDWSAERFLELGQETLTIARQSGGDCIIDATTFARELTDWQSELTVGSPFANLLAQDVMEPFPYVLRKGSVDDAKLAAIRRSGLPVWPFVDQDGKLVGIATPPVEEASWNQSAGENPHITSAITIDHNASFPEIYEKFSNEGCLEMIVVAEDRPIGYLMFNSFIALIEPIHTATFSSEEPADDSSSGLLVGSLIGTD